MPPEPPSLDRKDYGSAAAAAAAASSYKERKHHLYDAPLTPSGGGGGGTPRWRDPYHHHMAAAPSFRDYPRASPRRPPSGYYRQGSSGGYDRMYLDDPAFHGYAPSRSDRYYSEEENFRRFGHFGGSRSSRDGRDMREMRTSLRRSPWRVTNENSRYHHNHQYRLQSPVSQQYQLEQQHDPFPGSTRSVVIQRSPVSRITSDETPAVDKYKVVCNSDLERDHDRDTQARPWKSLKWPQSGPLVPGKDGCAEPELVAGLSPASALPESRDEMRESVVAAISQTAEEAPKKKPRLGWGQGLAKYEKQKVQSSVDPLPSIQETGLGASLTDKTTLTVDVDVNKPQEAVDCSYLSAQPTAACSSPSLIGDKCDGITSRCAGHINETVPCALTNESNANIPVTVEVWNTDPNNIAPFLASILAVDDSQSCEPAVHQTGMAKLLHLKEGISKELEKTELELDMMENQFKSVDFEVVGETLPDPSKIDSDAQIPFCDLPNDQLECSTNTKDDEIMACVDVESKEANMQLNIVEDIVGCSEDRPVEKVELEDSDSCIEDGAVRKVEIFSKPEEASPFQSNVCAVLENSLESNIDTINEESVILKREERIRSSDLNLFDILVFPIYSANRDAAQNASINVEKVLSDSSLELEQCKDLVVPHCKDNELRVQKMLSIRRSRLKFKEQILLFKFKALLHLWKEDKVLLSIRKNRAKSNKRWDLGSRASQLCFPKQPLLSRSHCVSHGSKPTPLPTPGSMDFARKLWSDFHSKRYRNVLKMPSQIIDDSERRRLMFPNCNGLIEDPISFEDEKQLINPWTEGEEEIFMEMLATFGKDFSKISSFLPLKTTADCVEFYYKNHKDESFKEVKKCLDLRKQLQNLPASTYLATSGKKWNPEKNAASLDMLGAASVVAAQNFTEKNAEKNSWRTLAHDSSFFDLPNGSFSCLDNELSKKLSIHYKESVAVDVLAGISGAMSSSDAMGSCVTSSADPGERVNFAQAYHTLIPDPSQLPDDEIDCSDEGCGEIDPVDWTDEEKSVFVQAMHKFGKNFSKVSACVKTRSEEQCKIFFSKARKSLGLDMIRHGSGSVDTPMSNANGGRSDSDDVGAVEVGSAICSTQSCSKVDGDGSPSVGNDGNQGSYVSEGALKQLDNGGSSGQDIAGQINMDESRSMLEKRLCMLDDKKSNPQQGTLDLDPSKTIKSPATESSNKDSKLLHERSLIPKMGHADIKSDASQLNCSGVVFLPNAAKREPAHPVLDYKVDVKAAGLHAPSDGGLHVARVTLHPSPSAGVKPLRKEAFLPVQFDSVLPCATSNCFDGVVSNTTFNFEAHPGKKTSSGPAGKLDGFPALNDVSTNHVVQPVQNILQGCVGRETDIISSGVHLPMNFANRHALPRLNHAIATSMEGDRTGSSILSVTGNGVVQFQGYGEKTSAQLKPCSQPGKAGIEEKQPRPGDVKLFGKVLSHRKSLDGGSHSLNDMTKSNLLPLNGQLVTSGVCNGVNDIVVYPTRPGTSGHLGVGERSLGNYGFCEVSPVLKSVPSPQESSVSMFSKHQRLLAGVPFYSAKNGILTSNWMLAGYPTTGLQNLEALPDMHRKNPAEIVSLLQQPGRVTDSLSPCVASSSISDPAAAALRTLSYPSNINTSSVNRGSEPPPGGGGIG